MVSENSRKFLCLSNLINGDVSSEAVLGVLNRGAGFGGFSQDHGIYPKISGSSYNWKFLEGLDLQ